ncbi:hypothetical protein, partial [Novosphingobium gossypii]|uniref:hypothetical protein n=1 Tax=Novosphingobium gossypii TaxID=1604774 RepID=UPI003D1F7468
TPPMELEGRSAAAHTGNRCLTSAPRQLADAYERAVVLYAGKICRRLAKNLFGEPQSRASCYSASNFSAVPIGTLLKRVKKSEVDSRKHIGLLIISLHSQELGPRQSRCFSNCRSNPLSNGL